MGVDGLRWLIDAHPDCAGFAITRQQTAISTPDFAERRLS